MKTGFYTIAFFLAVVCIATTGCSKKYGCPSNGKNIGAERLMSNEKVPKARKFKS